MIKLKSAFTLNLIVILLFAISAIWMNLTFLWIVAGIYTIILPTCSTKK